MASKDPRIDAYIEKAAPFAQPILKHLRKLVHKGCPAVEETIKWGMPHFDYKGLFCGMAAFKAHCGFGFWRTSMIVDEDPNGDREGMGSFGKITSVKDLPSDKKLLGYIAKAMALKDSGVKPTPLVRRPKKKPEPLEIPDDFKSALRNNVRARKTFEGFSPSAQKEYVCWVTEAKRAETREQRLATSMEWLAEGKPRNWKYQR